MQTPKSEQEMKDYASGTKWLSAHKLSRLSHKQVRSLDASKYFTSSNVDSKKFYLYADAMHLSPYGHKVVFEFMQEELLK